MELVAWGFLLVLACVSISSFLATTTRKAKHNLPPGPSPLPIIGNLLELGQKPHQSLAKLAKIYGPVMSLKLGRVTTIVISSADMAKEVLVTHDELLSNRPIPQSVAVLNHELYSLAFLPVSPLWRELRKICNGQLFAHKTLDESQHVRRSIVQQLLRDVHESCHIGEAVDVGRLAFKTTINILSNTIFSEDLVLSKGTAGEFKDLVINTTKLVGSPNIAEYFPVLKRIDPHGVKRQQTKNVAKLLDMFDGLIRKRLKLRESTGSVTHNDMLDALLHISKENQMMDKTMIQHLAHDLFVAGTDTTSSTLEWAMAEVIFNRKVMSKAKKEMEEVIGKGKAVEESDSGKLPYLEAIIKETFRLHPPVPLLLPRKAERDVDLCGLTVPKDAHVLVNVWNIGRDPTLWDNPTLFSPERFFGSNSKIDTKGRNFQLLPFGAGRRICPAVTLAIRMLLLMLGSLINSFDWKLEHDIQPQHMDMEENFGITLQKAQSLRIVPLNRSN
ncbi:hypothetical protein VNO78_19869 [Psophocarpus tetragonolobus]|uniref:Cytochrome P450 n=1 Tax=Psophocarpus tetragonolobus TaxID=3891 RepID=A0AAN9S8E7_PSOTE